MLTVADYYTFSLMGEDVKLLGCGDYHFRCIEKFREVESEGLTEWQVKEKTGIHTKTARSLIKAYCAFYGLPLPEFTTYSEMKKNRNRETIKYIGSGDVSLLFYKTKSNYYKMYIQSFEINPQKYL